MKLEHANLIVQAADSLGEELHLHENYSGRGMYGKTTAGVSGPLRHLFGAVAQAAVNIAILNPHGDKPDEFVEDMQDLAMDSMAFDTIIY